ncbi:MAG: DUF2805 domain-containing protein [Brachymonas sp.]|nr:DUF2805 domain-containing protein [Brachymonas sp.]
MTSLADKQVLTAGDISRMIEIAWEDRTPLEAIKAQFGLKESAVIRLKSHLRLAGN